MNLRKIMNKGNVVAALAGSIGVWIVWFLWGTTGNWIVGSLVVAWAALCAVGIYRERANRPAAEEEPAPSEAQVGTAS